MVRKALLPIMLCFLLMLSGCADKGTQPDSAAATSGNSATEEAGGRNNKTQANEESKMDSRTIKITIGDTALSAALEDNESAKALRAMMPVTIKMSGYGGFEQVGSLGKNLPRNDRQTTASAGDIMLYNGNSVVMFYGYNSWAYTRLGHITDQSAEDMTKLLGNGDVCITLSTDN